MGPKKIEINETPTLKNPNETSSNLSVNVETDNSEEEVSSDDESWTYKTSQIRGLKKKRDPPPLLDLDSLGKPEGKVYLSQEEELYKGFKEAGKWIGFLMVLDDFRKHIWSHKTIISENSMLYAEMYDRDRRRAIKDKVERFARIHREQLNMEEYYITTKNGIIAWVKTDSRLVTEIHKRAAKSQIKDFRTTNFVPKFARDRKTKIDGLLMGYKQENKDFRYIVRNGDQDIKVLIKRLSEGDKCPYRELSLKVLGRISPLKTQVRPKSPEKVPVEDEEGFSPTKQKDDYIPKEDIYKNITAILDGFDLQKNLQKPKKN